MINNIKTSAIFIILTSLLFYSCSKIDNYSPPNASISGALLDGKTNDTVPTTNNTNAFGFNYPDGVLNIYQQKYSSTASGSQGTSYSQNGTYTNNSIFSGTYKAIPVGAFYADTALLVVSGQTKHDFKVTPFANVAVQITSVTNSSITISYQVKGNDPVQNVTEAAAWLSSSAGVNRFSWYGANFNPVDNSSYRDDHSGLSGDASFTRTFINLQANTIYYIRAGALASGKNPQNYWNYSKVYQVQTKTN